MAGRVLPGALERRRLLEHVALLCDCGVGLGPIAAPLCALVKSLLGADAGSMFWVDAAGQPQGFYHDTAPAELKDLFITRFDELFGGPEELNFTTYLRMGGAPIGHSLEPEVQAWFRRGNIYRYLCRPLGHEHLLDMRLDCAGLGRAVVILWNKAEDPFTPADGDGLEPVRQLMEAALAAERRDAGWTPITTSGGTFVTDPAGPELVAIDARAEASLAASHLLAQQIPMAGQIRQAPAFAGALGAMLAAARPARLEFPVPEGRLVAEATAMRGFAGGSEHPLMSVRLQIETSDEVRAVNAVMGLKLTPLQRRLALAAMLGHSRTECAGRFGISEESLKKHLRPILKQAGAANWSELARASAAGRGRAQCGDPPLVPA